MNITANHINYTQGSKKILCNISFGLQPSDRCALLGHNGAGKTSLFGVLTDLIHPNTGSVEFDGHCFGRVKNAIGVLWDGIEIFPYLKVSEVVNYTALLYGKSSSAFVDIYKKLELDKVNNTLVKKLSRGEQQKLCILLATIHNPQVLLLDEPTTALDPSIRQLVWEQIFMSTNRTILFSTHHWDEAESYANKVMFISNGRLLNQPQDTISLKDSLGFTKKILLGQKIPLSDVDAFGYVSDNGFCYLVHGDNRELLDSITRQTRNFSILPVDLIDIYQYLIHVS